MQPSLQHWLDNLEDTLFEEAVVRLHQGLEAFHGDDREQEENKSREIATDYFAKALTNVLYYMAYQKSPLLLFRDLSIEWRLNMVQLGQSATYAPTREEELKIKTGHYPRIPLEEAIQLFEFLYPGKKHQLKSYWQMLQSYRNHEDSGFPVYGGQRLSEQFCFLALDVFTFLADDGLLPLNSHKLSNQDRAFIANYTEGRVQRVEKMVNRPGEEGTPLPLWPSNTWSRQEHKCPSCSEPAQLFGYTELTREGKSDHLTFYACLLKCQQHCGLVLFDPAELTIAGCTTIFDRSHQIDEWLDDHNLTTSGEEMLQKE